MRGIRDDMQRKSYDSDTQRLCAEVQWLRIVMQAAAMVLHCLVYKRNRSGTDLL